MVQKSNLAAKKKSSHAVDARDSLQSRQVAVIIDNENAFYGSLCNAKSFPKYESIMTFAQGFGRVVEAVAICDWTRLVKAISHVIKAGFRPVMSCHANTAYIPSNHNSKEKYIGKQSSSDSVIHVHIFELFLNQPEIEIYVLVSGDRDFVSLVHMLRRHGKYVVVLSEAVSLADDLRQAADETLTFQDIGALISAPDIKEDESS